MIMFLLLLFVVVFATLARKLRTPYPIILVLAGLVLSFIPGIPRMRLNPDTIFVVVLPPLLYSAAWLTSWRDFYYNTHHHVIPTAVKRPRALFSV
jgi:CPA1 family monovalent cation:H+ antiporter